MNRIEFLDFGKYGNRTAIITDEGILVSYDELNEKTEQISNVLIEQNVAIICCSNTIGSLVCYLACLKKGVVPLLLSDQVTSEELLVMVEKYKPKYLCLPDEYNYTEVQKVHITCVDEYTIWELTDQIDYVINQELVLLLSTSGTTNNAKCVRISYANINCNTKAICQYLNLNSQEIAITSLPMHYTYGLSIIHTHLYVGATILMTQLSILQGKFWSFFNKYKATSFSGVPYMYECLCKFKILERDLPTLRTFTQAGGKLSDELQCIIADYTSQIHGRFFIMYGQTEATARISYLPPELVKDKLGSIGISIPGGSLNIVNDEIVYSGENVCLGYANDYQGLSRGDENNGVLYTGDLGYCKDGLFYITGRKGREVKMNGRRVNLDDLERRFSDYFKQDIYCVYKNNRLFLLCGQWIELNVLSKKMSWLPLQMSQITTKQIENIPRSNSGKVEYAKIYEFI